MNKHLLMLSAAATVLLAQPVLAATTITAVGTSPIDTKTDGDITINSGGGVKIQKGSAAVTVNSSNFLNNGGLISNTNTASAKGILIDASGGALADTTGITNSGTIDLSGQGTTKSAIELSGGSFTGPIILTSSSVIRVSGDSSVGVSIDPGATLNGDMTLSGSLTMAPTNAQTLQSTAPTTLVNIAGLVNGNVVLDGSTVFTATGAGARGIVIEPTGSLAACNPAAVASCATTDIGTLTNAGNISLAGAVLTTGSSNKQAHPETGSALVVSGNIAGGIVNAGPASVGDTTTAATLSSSGLVTAAGTSTPVVLIGPSDTVATGSITIGQNTADTTDKNASFINRGTIVATPLNANNSTEAMLIVGQSGFPTTLSGNLVNAGAISAIASSAQNKTAASPLATAIELGPFSSVPAIVVSQESAASATSSNGSVNASVTGPLGGTARAIVIDASSSLAEIDVQQNAKIRAVSTTTDPNTATIDDAIAIQDASSTLKTINNAGTISATITTLTPNAGINVVSNFAHAIDLSASTIPVTINNSGTITGDVLLNSSGNGTVFTVGAGAATNGSANAVAAATAAATATGLTNTLSTQASVAGNIAFGGGVSTLYVNDFGSVAGQITSDNGTLDIEVSKHGAINIENTTSQLVLRNLNVDGGTIAISTSENLRSAGAASIQATGSATFGTGTALGVTIGSMVPQGTNNYVLIQTPANQLSIQPTDLQSYRSHVVTNLPFFFDKLNSSLNLNTAGPTGDQLVLTLTPKTPAALGLAGNAAQVFPFANAAMLNDDQLGAAVVNGIVDPATTKGTTAQDVYSQFTPDVSGNVRAEAIALTDSATGPVAARQRLLRSYADQDGEFTMWGQEFAQYINNKGGTGVDLTQSKSHGFGFALGMDGGDPEDGWYGGAFTFFAGDATQALPNDSKNQTEWYMLTGYTDWRGEHLFIDSHLDVAYGSLRGKRFLSIDIPAAAGATTGSTFTREADGKRAGLLGAFGVTTGAEYNWGNTVLMPMLSLDGMSMREEGYTELGGGDGFDLKVSPYYANSLRAFLGADVRQDFDLGDFTLQPEGRLGYRFDFLNDPVKIRSQFVSTPTTFTIIGPDPSRGNVVAGATIGASTDTWSMGLNFDWVRGSNGSTTEVGTVSLLGRI